MIPYHRPVEELEGRLVGVEEGSPFISIYLNNHINAYVHFQCISILYFETMLSVSFLYILYVPTYILYESILIYLVDVDDAEGEADVYDDEDEKEDEDVNDHVGHADDDGSSLSPHQPALIRDQTLKLFLKN